jgi:thiol-disulfide isomerase/thioredoxin
MTNLSTTNLVILFFSICLLFYLINYFSPNKNEDFTNNENNTIKIYNFNTTWCGHSLRFQPIWDEFTNSLKKSDNIDAIDLKCDNQKNSDLVKKYKVNGFPTVVIVDGDNVTTYEGPRTVNGLRSALKLSSVKETNVQANNNPVKCNCNNKPNMQNVNYGLNNNNDLNNNNTTIYNFNTKWCGYSVRFQPIWDEFMNNNTNPNIKIVDVKCDDDTNQVLCNKYDVPGYPTIIKDGPNGIETYSGPRTVDSLNQFASN